MSFRLGGRRCGGHAVAGLAFVLCAASSSAADKSGLGPGKLKLPAGPGSLEGVGENAEPNLSMGLMSYGVPVRVPEGYPGMTPSLRLAYSSGSGSSVAGIGWSLGTPTIERMTSKGLPRYARTDAFAVDGSEELVRVAADGTYRARHEGGFVRYMWVDAAADGREGYWKAEYPDGRVAYFGADAAGVLQDHARVTGPEGTFRYHLVEWVDPHGHHTRFEYVKDGSVSLLRNVLWVAQQDGAWRYRATLSYEARDDHLADGKPGFETRLTRRLADIRIYSRDVLIRRYHLAYEPDATAGGFTRLASVTQFAADDATAYPVNFSFSYTPAFAACDTATCQPRVSTLQGSVGPGLVSGTADLVDMNGDALPDVLETEGGSHRVAVNQYAGGEHHWDPAGSTIGTSASLGADGIQLVDMDGDGLVDLVDAEGDRILYGKGDGSWREVTGVATQLPDMGGASNFRFFDFDNDKRMDVLYADGAATYALLNDGSGHWDTTATQGDDAGGLYVTTLEAGFQTGLQLADLNGDGMQDAIISTAGGAVTYRLYLGRGRWTREAIEMPGLTAAWSSGARFVDVNGDSLSDALLVLPGEVHVALNRNGRAFAPPVVISNPVGGSIPVDPSLVLRLADLNASGSTDVAWVDASGTVTFLDLVPERAHLLRTIRNGIGKNIAIRYGSTVGHLARDLAAGAPWVTRLPNPVLTVDGMDTWDSLSGVHQVQSFRYHDGYWDGEEKQFRGFARVDAETPGDASVEDALVSHVFDVGRTDRYHKALSLEVTTRSASRVLDVVRNIYGDCPVLGVPAGIEPPVRSVCLLAVEKELQEGTAQGGWVTTREEYQYDGFGNRILTSKLGVVRTGAGACPVCNRPDGVTGAPCGELCLGDESFESTDYVPVNHTDGRWMLDRPVVRRSWALSTADAPRTEETTYYDGEPFVGLQAGFLTRGDATRITGLRLAGQAPVEVERRRFDAHGNVVEDLDATEHRRRYEYDAEGLLPVAEEIVFASYQLRTQLQYDRVGDMIVEGTGWYRPDLQAQPTTALFAYDPFLRLVSVAREGDTLQSPTETYEYDLRDPVSRIIKRERSLSGGPLNAETITCLDGMGRKFQTRRRVDTQSYQVDGFETFNARGVSWRTYEPYLGATSSCDHVPPADGRRLEKRWDAAGRELGTTRPDGSDFGGVASVATLRHLPLATFTYDEEDSDPASPHHDTPAETRVDGLGRATYSRRVLAPADPGEDAVLQYDALGRFRGFTHSSGTAHTEQRDLLGHVVDVVDSDHGHSTFIHDDEGRILEEHDATGRVRHNTWDEAGRRVEEWDADAPDQTRVTYYFDGTGDPAGFCTADDMTNGAGHITAVSFPLGTDCYGYDDRGQQVRVTRKVDGHVFRFQTEYDNLGRVRRQTLPGGQVVQHRADLAGRLIGIDGFVRRVQYTPQGLQGTVEFGNGTVLRQQHDARLMLRESRLAGPQGELLQSFTVKRDRAGNVVRLDALEGADPVATTFNYDAYYRVLGRTRTAATSTQTVQYAYGPADRLLALPAGPAGTPSGAVAHDDTAHPNAPTRVGDLTLEYDAAGRMVRRGPRQLDWFVEGRLREVREGSRVLGSYAYGPEGALVKKTGAGHVTYYATADFEIRDGVGVFYVRAGGQRVARVEVPALAADLLPDVAPASVTAGQTVPAPDASITASDAWVAHAVASGVLPAADRTLTDEDADAILAASARRLVLGTGSTTTFNHTDPLGAVTLTTDDSGRVIQRHRYSAYGVQELASRGWAEPHGFAGGELDDATGFIQFKARAYDPALGDWISPDRAFLVFEPEKTQTDAFNKFAYAHRNPVNKYDPMGEEPITLTVIATAIAVSAGINAVTQVAGATVKYFANSNSGSRSVGAWAKTVAKEWSWGDFAASAAIGGITLGAGAAAKNTATVGKMVIAASKEALKEAAVDAAVEKAVPWAAEKATKALTGDAKFAKEVADIAGTGAKVIKMGKDVKDVAGARKQYKNYGKVANIKKMTERARNTQVQIVGEALKTVADGAMDAPDLAKDVVRLAKGGAGQGEDKK
ncbi:MAG: VCBS repeat-containing protein [Deltaproteobacteria bacterium]|nr:VCBS repeat-containing protein [Deltaproteobacteria bacterium]